MSIKEIKAHLICLILIVCCFLSLSGCSNSAKPSKNNGKLKVVTTLFAAYDFAKQNGGEFVDVSMLLKPGAEAHSFEPTPMDIVNIGKCDVFVCNGGENEVWVDSILESIDNPNMTIIRMVDCCEGLEEEEIEGMQEGGVLADIFGEEHSHEDDDEVEWDEHVWMSPRNAALISKKICEAYCNCDYENADKYLELNEQYTDKLNKVNNDIENTIIGMKKANNDERPMLVFADRFPARYFVEEYGLDYRAAFSGCSANTQASAATVAFIIDLVKEKEVNTVYTMELSDGRLAAIVSEETGAKVAVFFTGHNVTLEDFEAGVTYIDLLYRNLEAISSN